MSSSNLYSANRTTWSGWSLLWEVGIFSIVLLSVSITVALSSLPPRFTVSEQKVVDENISSTNLASLSGLSEINIDEIGPWVATNSRTLPLYNTVDSQLEFTTALADQLQRKGVRLSHSSSAAKLRILVSYSDQPYAIRGPRVLKNLELDLMENVRLPRNHSHSTTLVTWSRMQQCHGDTLADLIPNSVALLDEFGRQVILANVSR